MISKGGLAKAQGLGVCVGVAWTGVGTGAGALREGCSLTPVRARNTCHAATGGLANQAYMFSGDKVTRQRLPRQICRHDALRPYSEAAALGADWLRRLTERRRVRGHA